MMELPSGLGFRVWGLGFRVRVVRTFVVRMGFWELL